MVVDKIDNAAQYNVLGKNFETAFAWLSKTDLVNAPAGKVEIDGTNVHANIMEIDSKTTATAKWEAHKQYADIQFLISGDEKIGYAHISRSKEVSYDEAKDFITLSAEGDFYVRMYPGQFAVLFPQDAHQPGLGAVDGVSSKIKKVVVKVKL